MAIAITVQSESSDYYTRAFENNCTLEDIRDWLESTNECLLHVIGFFSDVETISEDDVEEILGELEDHWDQ